MGNSFKRSKPAESSVNLGLYITSLFVAPVKRSKSILSPIITAFVKCITYYKAVIPNLVGM